MKKLKPCLYEDKKIGIERIYVNLPAKDGKRGKRPYFTSLEECQNFCNEYNKQIAKLSADAASITNREKEEYVLLQNKCEDVGLNIIQAANSYLELTKLFSKSKKSIEEVLKEHLEKQQIREKSETIGKLFDKFMDEMHTLKRGKRHIETLRYDIKRFVEDFGEKTKIADITVEDISDWLKNLKKRAKVKDSSGKYSYITMDEPVSDLTKNNYRGNLACFFKYCFRMRYVSENLIRFIPKISCEQNEPPIITPTHFREILKRTPEKSMERLYIVFAGLFGIRQSEILRLKGGNIKLDENEIILPKNVAKTKARRTVPILSEQKKWLEPYRDVFKAKFDGLIFVKTMANKIAKFKKRENINWEHNALRHSNASYMLARTSNSAMTSLQLGNSEGVLKQNYMSLVSEKDARDFFKITPESIKKLDKGRRENAA